jgi:hypothetical protein
MARFSSAVPPLFSSLITWKGVTKSASAINAVNPPMSSAHQGVL